MRHRLSPWTVEKSARGGEEEEGGERKRGRDGMGKRGAGRGRKKATRREKKIGIFLERRMIKLRMVRCYRNPDWDELRPSGTCISPLYNDIYVCIVHVSTLVLSCSIRDLILKCQCTRLAFNYKEKSLYLSEVFYRTYWITHTYIYIYNYKI